MITGYELSPANREHQMLEANEVAVHFE